MNKTIYFHIGESRTGSSFLQEFLSYNKPLLKSLGFYYENTTNKDYQFKNSSFYLMQLILKKYCLKKIDKDRLTILESTVNISDVKKELSIIKNNLEASNCSKVILSLENFNLFYRFQNNFIDILKNEFKDFDFKIIIYLREMSSWLLSAYSQDLKFNIITKTLEDYVHDYKLDKVTLFEKRYGPVFASFGVDNVFVRKYSSDGSFNVVEDFLHLLDLDISVFKKKESIFRNESLPPAVVEAKRLLNFRKDLSIHNDFQKIVDSPYNHNNFISEDLKRKLLRQSQLKKKYFRLISNVDIDAIDSIDGIPDIEFTKSESMLLQIVANLVLKGENDVK